MVDVTIRRAEIPEDIEAVHTLFVEYLNALDTEFDNEVGCTDGHADMQNFPQNYKALFVAKLDGAPVAACGVKRVNGSDCELVRLFCRPEGRGQNFGRKLSEAAQIYVKADGCARLVLSTEPIMEHAVRLYKDMGFVDIENYVDAPSACSKYMALQLNQ